MQSLFKVIKNNSINENGMRAIETNYKEEKSEYLSSVNSAVTSRYEDIASSILQNARKQSEELLSNTYLRAEKIEQEAYKKAYEAGEKQAYYDSYNRAYEENVIKAQQEAQIIINNAQETERFANSILLNANKEYENYVKEKKTEVKDLILEIVKGILQKEVKAEDSINKMVINALDQVKTVKTYVIKCNNLHMEKLKLAIGVWKIQLTYKCEVFVIEDNSIEVGNAVVEKDNGHIEVGIDIGFTRVKEILEENDI
ncbi:MAG: hypothetical protein H7Y18_16410 [Clostridiaceae bacterium]|nr:hypothetical protein [Clostridiaceae bacterium]